MNVRKGAFCPFNIMPFTRIKRGKNKGKYRSESGKIYTERQVRAYHATRGWKKKPKK